MRGGTRAAHFVYAPKLKIINNLTEFCGGGRGPEFQRSLVQPPGYSAAALVGSYPLADCEFGISNISDQETGL